MRPLEIAIGRSADYGSVTISWPERLQYAKADFTRNTIAAAYRATEMMISNMAQTFNCCKASKRLCQTVADAKKLLSFVFRVDTNSHRPVVHQGHLHVCAEFAGAHRTADGGGHCCAELFIERNSQFVPSSTYIGGRFPFLVDAISVN